MELEPAYKCNAASCRLLSSQQHLSRNCTLCTSGGRPKRLRELAVLDPLCYWLWHHLRGWSLLACLGCDSSKDWQIRIDAGDYCG